MTMKKLVSVLAVMMLVLVSAAGLAEANSAVRKGVEVAAVFAAPDIQPYTEADGEKEMLDTVWIYYTDGTFEQFAEVDAT